MRTAWSCRTSRIRASLGGSLLVAVVAVGEPSMPAAADAQSCDRSCDPGLQDVCGCCHYPRPRPASGPSQIPAQGVSVSCVPADCNGKCGAASDGCGHPLDCGRCPQCPPSMAPVPGGTFRTDARLPRGDVTVQPFCMDRTEVTVKAYAACILSGACTPATLKRTGTKSSAGGDDGCNGSRNDRQDHPINCVDWGQAGAYCRTRGERLPTQDEWEWAARGEEKCLTYPWGDAKPDAQLCWKGDVRQWEFNGEGPPPRDGTCPVGSFGSGDARGGIHDLAGNVSEWTSTATTADRGSSGEMSSIDAYDPAADVSELAAHGRSRGAATAPLTGPPTPLRVVRGSSWHDGDPQFGYGFAVAREVRTNFIGFRCVR